MNPGALIAMDRTGRRSVCVRCGRRDMEYLGLAKWGAVYGHAYHCHGCSHRQVYGAKGGTAG